MKKRIRLGVNLDHVVTLRQVRGRTTSYPNLARFIKETEAAGADQITVHLREDRRHIHEEDLALVVKKSKLLVNLEMAVTSEMTQIALKYRPDYVCLVPEKRQELTTEGGLDVVKMEQSIADLASKMKEAKIKVSTFIEPSLDQVEASFRVGAVAVEFHTGKWVHLKGIEAKNEWSKLVAAAKLAHKLGLQVHAGHGLDYHSARKIKKLPHLEEVNIGHFLICEALAVGFKKSIKEMVACLK